VSSREGHPVLRTLGLLTVEVKGLLSVLFQRYSPLDTAVGVAGLVMLALSLFVSMIAVKVVTFVLFLGALGFLYFSRRSKQERDGANHGIAIDDRELEKQLMSKKIVFDDLQTSPLVHYEEEVNVPSAATGEVQADQASTLSKKREVADFAIEDFFDLEADVFKSETEPRAEFDFLLSKVLSVAKEVLFAHTVALFWANRDKHQLVLEAKITDSDCFMAARRFSIETDIVSQIAVTGKPAILTQVNPISEKDLLRYYDQVDFVKSFIGAPVYFNQSVVAVLAADSRVEDAYGAETLSLIGQFTKLISALLKTYTDKYDLLVDSEILRGLKRIDAAVRRDFGLKSSLDSLMTEASRLVNWDFLAIVLYNEDRRDWRVRQVMNRTDERYLSGEETIDFDKSIVGSVIKSNSSRSIEDYSALNEARYFSGENLPSRGSLIILPISSARKCYGAFIAESRNPRNFSGRDMEVLQHLVNPLAATIEIVYLQDVVKEYVVVDELTATATKNYLLKRLEGELQHADDFGTDLSLVVFSIDAREDLLSRYSFEGFNFVLYAVGRLIQNSIRPYDVVGRLDANRFGVLLLNTAANDAYLWAEKIRKAIASNVLSFQDKNFSVTVSGGVCGAIEGMTMEDILTNAQHVLTKATESGGNLIRVY
jgi:diguanylate cyclase (GGDEF)-like protein